VIIMASASGTPVSAIARLVAAHEDTVRDVIHAFNQRGLAALDPQGAGGRPRLIRPDDGEFIKATATTRPTALGCPFTRWSVRKLADSPDPQPGPAVGSLDAPNTTLGHNMCSLTGAAGDCSWGGRSSSFGLPGPGLAWGLVVGLGGVEVPAAVRLGAVLT
jgi:hypothetical protein